MIGEFVKKVGQGILGVCTPGLFLHAFAFWGGAGLIWICKHGCESGATFYLNSVNVPVGVILVLGSLLVLILSAEFVGGATFSFLRLIEGYFPRPFTGIRDWLVRPVKKRFEKKKKRLEELKKIYIVKNGKLTKQELGEYVQLDKEMNMFYPAKSESLLPFHFGNILRAAETYPKDRYGLESIIMWPRLWLILPKQIQMEITDTRKQMDNYVQLMIWGILFASWSFLFWWVLLISLFVVLFAHHCLLGAAESFGELLRAAFDIYRFDLYRALHWPLPGKPCEEVECGLILSKYLFRGQVTPDMVFDYTKKKRNQKNKNKEECHE